MTAAPYGVPFEQYSGLLGSLGFTGEMTDRNGLQYLRARYYNPTLGIFLSADPVQGILGGSSIRWNSYIYAGANPVNYIDPSGEFPWLIPIAMFLLGAGIDVASQMIFEGRSLGNINWLSAIVSGGLTALGWGAGKWIKAAGWIGSRAWTAAGIFDVGAGFLADRYVLGHESGSALLSNLIGFGIGEAIGYGPLRVLDDIASFTVVRSDIRICRQIFAAAQDAGSLTVGQYARLVDDLFEHRGVTRRMADWWLDKRGLQILYRGQTRSTRRIMSPIARKEGIAASEEFYEAALENYGSRERLANLTARFNDGPITPGFPGDPMAGLRVGGVGIPASEIPAIAAGFYTGKRGRGPVYAIRAPKGAAVNATHMGWQPMNTFEREWVLFNEIPNQHIFGRRRGYTIPRLAVWRGEVLIGPWHPAWEDLF